jgi:Putative zinc-finger
MERASLRPVPQRPSGPVDPAAALAHVGDRLPGLDEAALQALSLVDLVGRTRPEVCAETGIADAELADTLARARKALRRAAVPLPGSGWCERAERLLSDELDGALDEPGPRRLAAHLANCDRCVEHERRLWQARDQLVISFEESRAPAPVPAPEIVDEPDPEPVEVPDPEPLRLVEAPPPGTEPFLADGEVQAPGTEPFLADGEEQRSAAEDDSARKGSVPARLAWTASMAVAVLLAIVSLALTIYAIAGGSF